MEAFKITYIEYLHFYCDPPLYHGDVRPSNVLLDKNYLAKLVTGKPVIQGNNRSLVEWSRELIGTDYRLHELVDPAVADAFDLDELQVVADVIHWCTHRDGAARPSMKQVLRILHERLDPLSGRFARAVEGEEGYYYCGVGGRAAKGKLAGAGEVIQFSGEAARSWLPSSSSTSRSHCSRSVLLECNSPEQQLSPPPAHGNGAFLA
nr:unnamed protein product [Digitaria exilis]